MALDLAQYLPLHGQSLESFCAPVIDEQRIAATALELMVSRYFAYVRKNPVFLLNTVHPAGRAADDEKNLRTWLTDCQWKDLEVLGFAGGQETDREGLVEFRAAYTERGESKVHHEVSRFIRGANGQWYYLEGRGGRLPRKPAKRGPIRNPLKAKAKA